MGNRNALLKIRGSFTVTRAHANSAPPARPKNPMVSAVRTGAAVSKLWKKRARPKAPYPRHTAIHC
jgi:hypothetical protein